MAGRAKFVEISSPGIVVRVSGDVTWDTALQIFNLVEKSLSMYFPTHPQHAASVTIFSSEQGNVSLTVSITLCIKETAFTFREMLFDVPIDNIVVAVDQQLQSLVEQVKSTIPQRKDVAGEGGVEEQAMELMQMEVEAVRRQRSAAGSVVEWLKWRGYTDEEIHAILSQAAEVVLGSAGGYTLPLSDNDAERLLNHLKAAVGRKEAENLIDFYTAKHNMRGDDTYDFLFKVAVPSLKHAVLRYLEDTGRGEKDGYPLVHDVKRKVDLWTYDIFYFIRHLISTGVLARYEQK